MPSLHEELASVLSEQGNLWMSVTELTRAVNARGHTTRRGDPVMRITVDTRTRELVDVFEREGSRVRLRSFETPRLTPIDVADGDARKVRLPQLEGISLSHFSLYRNRTEIDATFGPGVFCLAGANGLGKSTFLAAISFGLTGIVADPNRKFESLKEYYSESLPYSRNYFRGRIGEFDREAATITLKFALNAHRYELTRGMFDVQALRAFSVRDLDGSSVDTPVATDEERHTSYVQHLLGDCRLGTFEQFVFLQHFLFTFDERRHLLFWDQRVAEQALYLAFGVDHERAAQADAWRRQVERNDSQARNHQYQATAARQQLEELRRRAEAPSTQEEELVARHQNLIQQRDESVARLATTRHQFEDADLAFQAAIAERSAASQTYDELFRARLIGSTEPKSHPIVREAEDTGRCGVCGTDGGAVSTEIARRLASHHCPLCGSAIHTPAAGPGDEHLQALDAVISAAELRLEGIRREQTRMKGEVSAAQVEIDRLNDEINQLEKDNESLRPGGQTIEADAVARIANQYQQEIESALRRKEQFRVRRDEAQERLRSVQEDLRTAYATAELEFVPRFAALARAFLGLDLEVSLAAREGSVGLLLTVEGSRRRAVDQLSESQRYFIEIAVRMALAQHMTIPGEPATLYIDTPEGSLDIAYESRAGDMFGSFVEDGHRVVMTANINTSQLLIELARRCGSDRMTLLRMTDWTTLSEVQLGAEGLFDTAFSAIERALIDGDRTTLGA